MTDLSYLEKRNNEPDKGSSCELLNLNYICISVENVLLLPVLLDKYLLVDLFITALCAC